MPESHKEEAVKNVTIAMPILVLLCILGCQPPPPSNPVAEKAAAEAAAKWLKLMDEGKDAESWDELAATLQAVIPRQLWIGSTAPARRIMGGLVSRTVNSKQYATTLPGLPDGEYVMIQYNSVFEKKKAAMEVITVAKQEDGTWRVSGYFIQ